MTAPIHPIEVESYRILADRVDLSTLPTVTRSVVERIVHASADLEYVANTTVVDAAVESAVDALVGGAPVICDVEMVRYGITGTRAVCGLNDVSTDDVAAMNEPGLTRSALGIRQALARHPEGAVVVVGCAPTALEEVIDLVEAGAVSPVLIIGMPVGFVGAAESKERLRQSGLPAVSNAGEKGGSAVAAAAANALLRLAKAKASTGAGS